MQNESIPELPGFKSLPAQPEPNRLKPHRAGPWPPFARKRCELRSGGHGPPYA